MKEPTPGEKAADRLRSGMGSWWFVGGFVLFMAIWAALNTLLLQRTLGHKPIDPYPYILLNLMLSMLAGLQGAIILISEKRGEQLADIRQKAISAKLDELIKVNKAASDELIDIEEEKEGKLEEVRREAKSKKKKSPRK